MSKEQTTKKKPSKKSPAAGKPAKLAAKHQKGTEVGAVAAQGAGTAKGNGKPAHAAQARSAAPDPRLPAVGTTIEKSDRHDAVRCKCTIEEGGIRYEKKVYTSLSGAAMAAAKDLGLKNKTQNGFIFWGLVKPPRPASDPILALERAWERYRDRVEALVKESITEENRSKVAASLGKHAQLIEKLGGSATLKGASAK
jgi:hypothetical protein